jgi:hypothetical protein
MIYTRDEYKILASILSSGGGGDRIAKKRENLRFVFYRESSLTLQIQLHRSPSEDIVSEYIGEDIKPVA